MFNKICPYMAYTLQYFEINCHNVIGLFWNYVYTYINTHINRYINMMPSGIHTSMWQCLYVCVCREREWEETSAKKNYCWSRYGSWYILYYSFMLPIWLDICLGKFKIVKRILVHFLEALRQTMYCPNTFVIQYNLIWLINFMHRISIAENDFQLEKLNNCLRSRL